MTVDRFGQINLIEKPQILKSPIFQRNLSCLADAIYGVGCVALVPKLFRGASHNGLLDLER